MLSLGCLYISLGAGKDVGTTVELDPPKVKVWPESSEKEGARPEEAWREGERPECKSFHGKVEGKSCAAGSEKFGQGAQERICQASVKDPTV